MKQIVKHIEVLLTKHDCVIVPGLGGFITRKESAKLIGHRLFPPTTTISFNSLLTHSDGLLAEALMQNEHVDYKSALQIIERAVASLHHDLNAQGMIELGRMGSLFQNEQHVLHFAPSTAEFLPDNFGLRPVYLSPLQVEEKPASITIPLPQQGSQVWRYAAAIILLGVITLFMPKPILDDYHKAAIQLNIPTSFEKAEVAIQELPAREPAEALVIDTEPEATAMATKETKSAPLRYHLIVASLPSYESAVEYCKVKSSSCEPLQVISVDGKHRIAAKSFETNTEAFAYLDSIRNDDSKKKAWILKATL